MTQEQQLRRLADELKVLRSNSRVPHSRETLTEAIAVVRQMMLVEETRACVT